MRVDGSASSPPRGLVPDDVRGLARLARTLPAPWRANVRRRRCLALALAAPGYVVVASTPLHHSFAALVLGLLAFAAALGFRSLTEPLFLRAEAAAGAPQPAAVLAEEVRARHA